MSKLRDGYASYFVRLNVGQQRRKTLGKVVPRQPEADALDDV
jgi:hypothetical protein